MMLISIGALVGFNRLDLKQVFTMIYLFSFIQGSIGFLPALITFMQDARVALGRISTFLKLPEVDLSYINVDSNYENAVEITGSHDYSYGLEEDYKIQPALDPKFFMKRDK